MTVSAKQACSKCKVSKPFDSVHFVLAPTCRTGLSRVCKGCRNAYNRTWKQDNAATLKPRRRAAYSAKEKVVEARRQRKCWRLNPIRQRSQVMRSSVVQRARRLRLPVDDEMKTTRWYADRLRANNSHCECCNAEFDLRGARGRGGPGGPSNESPSIDRLVPEEGYVHGNVAIICWRCNNLKRDASPEELERVAKWMRKCLASRSDEAPKAA